MTINTFLDTRMRCPTCGAQQEWSSTCRRCKGDLGLLEELAESCRRLRAHVIHNLQTGHYRQALRQVEQLLLLVRDQPTERLHAICLLCCQEYEEACSVAQNVAAE